MRKTKEEAEKTRVAILEAAEALFFERGVAHTTLEQIARSAGVTRGAIYWHFQNKAHLFHAMVEQIRLPPEQMACILAESASQDALPHLFELCCTSLRNLAVNPQKKRVLTILLHRCEFTDELREAEERNNHFIDQFIQVCTELFRNSASRLRPGVTPELAASLLHAYFVGICSDWLRKPDSFDLACCTDNLMHALFLGLLRDWPQAEG